MAANISDFGLFYLFAQALERLAEMVSYVPIGTRWKASDGQPATKATAVNKRNLAQKSALQALTSTNQTQMDADAAATRAAEHQQDVEVIRRNRSVFFLGLNTALAALVCGYFKVLLLKSVGVQNLQHDWMDVTVTAFAIGGGTKPLHDLIQNLAKAKEKREDRTTTT